MLGIWWYYNNDLKIAEGNQDVISDSNVDSGEQGFSEKIEREEQELIQKMNEEITDNPENINTVEPSVISSSKPTNTVESREPKNTLLDKVLGSTQESCFQKQEALAKGAARAEMVTLGACAVSLGTGGTFVPADAGCALGLGVSITTEAASQVWKGHCSTLPLSNNLPPN